ncbi:hypothetical protein M595_4209 [Lyngbya aestuarii BL J]|uniref:Uncharacterized protein n=1 Tax=Lyngbya aestuarii BL J TaxID=1348334 RepID=U7QEX0_9CYAN|nr:hypothetical protein [Lyngbya aestuarii]ERT05827.1 hypothetical protein M595_4209 [Lyngbya aestuarii BL J]
MIGKILGFNKKSDYFLELDDSKETQSAPSKPAQKEEAKPAPVEAKAKKEEPTPSAKTSKKTTTKAKAKPATPDAKEQAKATVEAISVKPKELPSFNNGLQSTPTGMTFAPDNLMKSASSSRRRPGPSMNMFKDMARQVGSR